MVKIEVWLRLVLSQGRRILSAPEQFCLVTDILAHWRRWGAGTVVRDFRY